MHIPHLKPTLASISSYIFTFLSNVTSYFTPIGVRQYSSVIKLRHLQLETRFKWLSSAQDAVGVLNWVKTPVQPRGDLEMICIDCTKIGI